MTFLYPPYKGFRLYDITQKFGVNPNTNQPHGHTGVDFCPPNAYGKILVAPEQVKIVKVVSETVFGGNFYDDLQKGFGLTMRSLANPNITYTYWHTMEIIPVKEGQFCEQGEMVAQIGNSGYCFTGGVYVPLADRNSGKGSHLHYERRDSTKNPGYTDVTPFLDYTVDIKLSWGQSASQVVQQISNMLANRK